MENMDIQVSTSCKNYGSDSLSRSNAKAKLIGRIFRNSNRKSAILDRNLRISTPRMVVARVQNQNTVEYVSNPVFSNNKESSTAVTNETFINRSELGEIAFPSTLNHYHQVTVLSNVGRFKRNNEYLNAEDERTELIEPTTTAKYTMKLVINKKELGKSSSAAIPGYFPQADQLVSKSWFTFSAAKKLYYPLSIVRIDEADGGDNVSGSEDTENVGNGRGKLETSHMKLSITIRSECSDEEEQPDDFTTQTSPIGGVFWFLAIRSVHVSGRVLMHFSCPDAPHVRPLVFRVPILPQSDPKVLSTHQRALIPKAADPVTIKRRRQQNRSCTENSRKLNIPKAAHNGRSLNSNPSHTDAGVSNTVRVGCNQKDDDSTEVEVGNALPHLLTLDWGNNFDHTVCGHYTNDTYANCRYRKYTCTRCGSRLYSKVHALQHVSARQPPCATSLKPGNKVPACPNPIEAVKELIRDYWAQEDGRMHKESVREMMESVHNDVAMIDTNISTCSNDSIVLSQHAISPSVGGVSLSTLGVSSMSHTTMATAMGSSPDLNTHSSISSSIVSYEKDSSFIHTERAAPCHEEGSQSPQSIVSTETEMQMVQYDRVVIGGPSTVTTSLQTPRKTSDPRPVAAYTMKLVIHTGSSINGTVSSHCIPSHFQQTSHTTPALPGCRSSWLSLANSSSETLYYPLSIVRMDHDADSGNSGGGGGGGKVETIPHAKVSLTIRSECSDEEEQPDDFTTQTSPIGGVFWFLAIRSVHVSGRVLMHFSCPDAPHVRPLVFRVPIIPQLDRPPLKSLSDTSTCSLHIDPHRIPTLMLYNGCGRKDAYSTGDTSGDESSAAHCLSHLPGGSRSPNERANTSVT